jgi:hypothetical protein
MVEEAFCRPAPSHPQRPASDVTDQLRSCDSDSDSDFVTSIPASVLPLRADSLFLLRFFLGAGVRVVLNVYTFITRSHPAVMFQHLTEPSEVPTMSLLSPQTQDAVYTEYLSRDRSASLTMGLGLDVGLDVGLSWGGGGKAGAATFSFLAVMFISAPSSNRT